ncbi:MAG: class I SAM-dependent methyltransferase [Anaerolineae bacterium]|nr:class I SAM-dependent methyltransferase [Anaerolineae bacterium]
MPPADNTTRFSSRTPYYHASRPRYPQAVIDLLVQHLGLTLQSLIADIGAGTGISSQPFLDFGCTVCAVEPNADMRAIAAQHYGSRPNLTLIDAAAEATTLPGASVDFVVAGQAFHWFDPEKTRAEFQRILKPDGWIVLFWNTREDESSEFMREYKAFLETFDHDHGKTRWQATRDGVMIEDAYFGEDRLTKHVVPNPQHLDFDGLLGRALSASYMPLPETPEYPPMLAALRELFDRHQQNGIVIMNYITEIFWRHA